MGDKSQIEWTNTTWNVFTGCDKVSPGCKNCYAEKYAKRLQAMGVGKYSHGFKLTFHPNVLNYPLKLKQPRMVFVNSMSDLFHDRILFEQIDSVFEIMQRANWHTYQILTKRNRRLVEFGKHYGKFPDNVWIGVSIESSTYKNRMIDLKKVSAKTHFLSIEPLLGPVGNLDLSDIEWVIAGGESGPNFRECNIEWVREIRNQCLDMQVPFFFKQWGGLNSKSRGRILDGRLWNEFPQANIKETDLLVPFLK